MTASADGARDRPAAVSSFAPIANRDARVLVLGSMPGARSLAANQYYAHPQNRFWWIMGQLFDAAPEHSYAQRTRQLRAHGVALWDVLQSCVRPGSLDADIDPATVVANDFAALFARCPRIGAVLCNGGTAWQFYRRYVLPDLPQPWASLPVTKLPSTSPAHASMRPAQKLAAWRRGLRPFLSG